MASSSSSTSCNWVFDVFVSFSGEDVRRKVLSHLLLALDRKLITSFKDNEIQKSQSIGRELEHAIRNSRIAIVIFSKTYASSSWCLNELLEIVKCKEDKGQTVIPVFYGLDPSHVRKQTGEFGKGLEKTCENKADELQMQWREALTGVSNTIGYHSANWYNEANMVEEIANDVLGKLNITPSLDFRAFLGIEHHLARMSLLLGLEFEEVRMVGLWGPSGIGKTTIARALYSRISRHFQSSVFIDKAFVYKTMEIFRTANPDDYNMKLHLQETFLSEILNKKDLKIHHLGVAGERLKHKKVLIVLDDLDDQIVLDALVGGIQWFGCGSRILVITKDKHVLRAHMIDRIYEVGFPSDKQALEMFCQYAFWQNSPRDGFVKLASKVAKRAGNLPLGLNVLGLYLRGRDKEDWLDMLPRLQKRLYKKIEKVLRVSYDGLDSKEDKAIFCHIACLFNGMEANDIKLLLADSELDVNIGLKNLIDNSLIHVRGKIVHIHCLLQEMGKEIIRKQSNKPRKREFLVDSKDIWDVLNGSFGAKKVLGLSLNLAEFDELHVDKRTFKRMPYLHFLRIYEDSLDLQNQVRLLLPEGLDYFPPKLKLLCWDRYPMRCLPSSFRAEHLIVLRMRNSKLEMLWEAVESSVCLEDQVELPSKVRNLNKLYMQTCSDLNELNAFPASINLKSLYRLDLGGCSQFRSFPNISKNISFLSLNQTAIEEVPWWIHDFSSLVCLEMWECKNLRYISPNISKLKLLEKADFSNSGALTYASWLGRSSDMATGANNIHTMLPALNFINCFKLDQEALIQQSGFRYIILPGGEVPSCFTNRATGSSLAICLRQRSLFEHFLGFRVCIVVDTNKTNSFTSSWICGHFTRKDGSSFDTTDCHLAIDLPRQMDDHMVIFNCRVPVHKDNDSLAELNNDRVDIKITFTSDLHCKIKRCGVRLSEVCSYLDNGLINVCEANESTMKTDGSHGIKHGEECGDSCAETRRSKKRVRITGKFIQERTFSTANP